MAGLADWPAVPREKRANLTLPAKRPRCANHRCQRRFLQRFESQRLCPHCWSEAKRAEKARVQPELALGDGGQ